MLRSRSLDLPAFSTSRILPMRRPVMKIALLEPAAVYLQHGAFQCTIQLCPSSFNRLRTPTLSYSAFSRNIVTHREQWCGMARHGPCQSQRSSPVIHCKEIRRHACGHLHMHMMLLPLKNFDIHTRTLQRGLMCEGGKMMNFHNPNPTYCMPEKRCQTSEITKTLESTLEIKLQP